MNADQYQQAKFPLVLGRDFSGAISTIADDVADFKVDDEIFGVCEAGQEGAYAEKIAIKAAIVAVKPKVMSHIDAALLAALDFDMGADGAAGRAPASGAGFPDAEVTWMTRVRARPSRSKPISMPVLRRKIAARTHAGQAATPQLGRRQAGPSRTRRAARPPKIGQAAARGRQGFAGQATGHPPLWQPPPGHR